MDRTSSSSHDKEKFVDNEAAVHHADVVSKAKDKEERPEAYYVERFGRFGPFLEKLFASGVEARGVERVPEDQRTMKNAWNKYVRYFACIEEAES